MRLVQSFLVAGTAAAVVLTLAGCGGGDAGDGDETLVPPIATGTIPPSDEPTDAPSATVLPADCLTLVSQADPSTFTVELNSSVYTDVGQSGVKAAEAPAADATPLQTISALSELYCLWADPNADVSHLRVQVGHAETGVQDAMIAALTTEGYDCAEANGGTQCSITTPNTQYPTDDHFTYLFRDDVVIEVDQTNFPTNNLMGSMAQQIWG